jgi:chorismate mutase
LYEIAQHALDLDFDGLMLESHISPDTAWSDAKQQVTPQGLETLLNQLITRQLDTDNLDYLKKINQFRTLIDNLDTQTLHLLSERMEIVRQIGLYKKESNIAILQIERWLNVREGALKKAAASNLSEDFVEDIINTIHKESIRQQTTIMRKDS